MVEGGMEGGRSCPLHTHIHITLLEFLLQVLTVFNGDLCNSTQTAEIHVTSISTLYEHEF